MTMWIGAVLVLVGGALQGAFAVPMKYARKWKHEHIWFVYSLTGLLVLPWIFNIAAVPALVDVYRATPPGLLLFVAGNGLGWGVGALLVGLPRARRS